MKAPSILVVAVFTATLALPLILLGTTFWWDADSPTEARGALESVERANRAWTNMAWWTGVAAGIGSGAAFAIYAVARKRARTIREEPA